MAYTSFMRGDNTKMTNTPYTDGLIFLNTEEQALYLDDNNERIPMGGAGTGGHIIENNAGTDMTERTNLQFGGVYVSDDETNDRTKVNVTRDMTKDAFDQLTTAEKLGVIVTSNDPNDYVPFSADMVEYDNTNSGMTATDVQDAIDELNSDIANAGTMKYDYTTDMIQLWNGSAWQDWQVAGLALNPVFNNGVLSPTFSPLSISYKQNTNANESGCSYSVDGNYIKLIVKGTSASTGGAQCRLLFLMTTKIDFAKYNMYSTMRVKGALVADRYGSAGSLKFGIYDVNGGTIQETAKIGNESSPTSFNQSVQLPTSGNGYIGFNLGRFNLGTDTEQVNIETIVFE